jgi:hypothetical protein
MLHYTLLRPGSSLILVSGVPSVLLKVRLIPTKTCVLRPGAICASNHALGSCDFTLPCNNTGGSFITEPHIPALLCNISKFFSVVYNCFVPLHPYSIPFTKLHHQRFPRKTLVERINSFSARPEDDMHVSNIPHHSNHIFIYTGQFTS